MSDESELQAFVNHRFSASAERVFDAWLDVDMLSQWMFGPALRDEQIVRMTVDGRVGGQFSFVVLRQGAEIEHAGEYLEIDRPRRLAFTWGVPSDNADVARVIVDISPLADGCELTLVHELHPNWASYRPRTEAGWKTMLAALDAALGQD